jgi:hypothetical protein
MISAVEVTNPEKEGMPHLPFGGLGAVLDLGEKLRLRPDAAMCDPLGVGLGLADERPQTLAQIGGRLFVESVVDLAGIDEILALAAGQIDTVPFLTVEGNRRLSAGCSLVKSSS